MKRRDVKRRMKIRFERRSICCSIESFAVFFWKPTDCLGWHEGFTLCTVSFLTSSNSSSSSSSSQGDFWILVVLLPGRTHSPRDRHLATTHLKSSSLLSGKHWRKAPQHGSYRARRRSKERVAHARCARLQPLRLTSRRQNEDLGQIHPVSKNSRIRGIYFFEMQQRCCLSQRVREI